MTLHLLTAHELHHKFLKGELTAVEITRHFLDRIDRYNDRLGAFLSVFHERAMKKAEEIDAKKKNGEHLGHLASIPIAVKDNMHIKGETTTCGSQFLRNFKAPFWSTAVRLIEEEDGILIGKTNLDEFAMGSSNENSSFFPVKNPWDTNCAPGGSSGGSAVAVAARLCPIALGSDTGGSIRQPASLTGVVGFKPTYGRVSRFGLVAFGSSLDQIGPLANCTEDAALMMEVIGRHCKRDSTSIPEGPEHFLAKMNDMDNLQGVKVGIPMAFLEGLSKDAKKLFDDSITTMKEIGADVKTVNLDLFKYSIAVYYILATAEASTNLARFDGVRYGVRSPNAKTLDEVYELSKEEGFGPEVKRRILLGTFVLSSGYQDAYYKQAQKVRTLMIRQIEEAFKTCDIIAMPVSPSGSFPIGSIKDPLEMYLEDIYTIGANLTGTPAISVPCGFISDNKPYGLHLIGPQKQDSFVFQVARQFEKNCKTERFIPEMVQ